MEKYGKNKKYLVVVPLILVTLILFSISGIVLNALALQFPQTRNISVAGLEPDEVREYVIIVSASANDKINLEFKFENLENAPKGVNIYISQISIKPDITTITELEKDSAFYLGLLNVAKGVTDKYTADIKIDAPEDIDGKTRLYVIFGNENNNNLSFTVKISETNTQGLASSVVYLTKIILAIVFTIVFSILFVFSAIEILEPKTYKAKILTTDLDKQIAETIEKMQNTERLFALIGGVLLLVSYEIWITPLENTDLAFIGIAILVLTFYFYNKRQSIQTKIRVELENRKKIKLAELASLIGETTKNVQKALTDLIYNQSYPARYNHDTDEIEYVGGVESTISSVASQSQTLQVQQSETSALATQTEALVCAYCSTPALSNDAIFCHSCGASISSAK